jgi:hypothetical protein
MKTKHLFRGKIRNVHVLKESQERRKEEEIKHF